MASNAVGLPASTVEAQEVIMGEKVRNIYIDYNSVGRGKIALKKLIDGPLFLSNIHSGDT